MRRAAALLGLLVLSLLLAPVTEGAATDIAVRTDRSEYPLGATVEATVVVTHDGPVGEVPPVRVEWRAADGRVLAGAWAPLSPNGTDRLEATARWTATVLGDGLTVTAAVNDTRTPGRVLAASATFRVRADVAADLTQGRIVALLLAFFAIVVFALLLAVPVLRARHEEARSVDRRLHGATGNALEPGASYAVPEAPPDQALRLFEALVQRGLYGLTVSRIHPHHLLRLRSAKAVRSLWLSRAFGRGSVNPTDLEAVQDEIEHGLSGTPRSVILFEGVDYLLSRNEEADVRRFLHALRAAANTHRSVLLLTYDPNRLDPSVRARLFDGFRPLPPDLTASRG